MWELVVGEFFCEINILQGKMEIFFFFYDEQNYRKLADLSVLLLFISLNVSVEISKRYFAKKLKIFEIIENIIESNYRIEEYLLFEYSISRKSIIIEEY